MSQYHGTSMERRQQAADDYWQRLERREMAEGLAIRPIAPATKSDYNIGTDPDLDFDGEDFTPPNQ